MGQRAFIQEREQRHHLHPRAGQALRALDRPAYTLPEHIRNWNFALDDWHCPAASIDLREEDRFTSRMEARDGSTGFDFVGTHTKIVAHERTEYASGGRHAAVESTQGDQTRVQVSFDPEDEHPVDQQRSGWQAILNNFAGYVGKRNPTA